MKSIILTFCFFLSFYSSFAQLKIEWQKCFGGSGSENAYSVTEAHDKGFISAGYTGSSDGDVTNYHGGGDAWVIKTDINGNLQWQKCLGGTDLDLAYSIIATNDGGYLFQGSTRSNDGDVTGYHGGNYGDIWVVKLDSLGNMLWQHCYGGTSLEDPGNIIEVSNGYVFIGTTTSNDGDVIGYQSYYDPWLVKIDYSGNIIWQKIVYGPDAYRGQSVRQTDDGGFLISGDASNLGVICQGSIDLYVLKVDSIGNLITNYCRGGPDEDAFATSIPTSDHGSLLMGRVMSGGGNITGFQGGTFDIWVVKNDSLGNIEWEKCIGGSNSEYSFSIIEISDGSFILSGNTNSTIGNVNGAVGNQDMWVVKLDPYGVVLYTKSFGGTNSEDGWQIIKTTNDKFVVAGSTSSNDIHAFSNHGSSDFWLVKLYEEYNSITGNVFADLNSNFIKDANEPVINNKKITEIDTSKFTFSNTIGNYNLILPDSGNYTVFPQQINYFNAVPVSHSASFSGVNLVDSLNDFAYQPTGTFNDLKITISPVSSFVSGFTTSYVISYENVGNTVLNGTVTAYIDNNTYFVSSSLAPSFVSSDSLKWNVGTLMPFQSGNITLAIHIDSLLIDGTIINTIVNIAPYNGDSNASDNYSSWQAPSTSAYDPNIILVNREAIFNTEIASAPYLDYIIYFQNTGTAPCVNVKVCNNLPNFLIENSFEFVASSHPINITYDNYARLMTYSFNNINLPDSGFNEPASHGFIRYRIKPVTTMILGDSIKNAAAIYFDFNPPIITNKAITEIVLYDDIDEIKKLTASLKIFPNPSSNSITFASNEFSNDQCELKIYDLYGRIVKQQTFFNAKSQIKTDVSIFTSGIYFVEINQNDKVLRGKFLKE